MGIHDRRATTQMCEKASQSGFVSKRGDSLRKANEGIGKTQFYIAPPV